ncbi:helix-turn-helix transcriptional regulator [Povalibacter uvarum]|uniref:helix-turn-helix transcriptional regulator n=1 Tax=Povalibacter uvarum TaxID=732238 RepID=UPI001607C146|nr:helix-turn-helix transcriptional regulator [Povalibacter uvarum]
MKNRLRELREQKGWSQQTLAEKLDVSRQTVISIELGKYDPSLPLAFAIASTFSSRIEDIFTPDVRRRS